MNHLLIQFKTALSHERGLLKASEYPQPPNTLDNSFLDKNLYDFFNIITSNK